MGAVFKKVLWTSEETGVEEEVGEILDININRALESKSTTGEVRFKNYLEPNSSFRKMVGGSNTWLDIKSGDTMEVYASWSAIGSSPSSSDLLLAGDVKEVSQEFEEDSVIINVSLADKTYLLLSNIPAKRIWKSQKPYNIVQNIVRQVASDSKGEFTITDAKGNDHNYSVDARVHDDATGGSIQSTHPLGGDFAPIDFTGSMENAYEMVRKVSSPDKCLTASSEEKSPRSFIFWVDSDRVFHWEYPSSSADYDVSDETFYSKSFSIDSYDKVNMYIMDCGLDPNGDHIYWYKFNDADPGGELKSKFVPLLHIASDLKAKERTWMDERYGMDVGVGTGGTWDGYPTGYPYTTTWGETISSSILGDWKSDRDYNSAFREQVMDLSEDEATHMFKYTGEGRIKGEVEIRGTNDFKVGKTIGTAFLNFGLNATGTGEQPTVLRISEITHNISKGGWYTTLRLEEDETEKTTGEV